MFWNDTHLVFATAGSGDGWWPVGPNGLMVRERPDRRGQSGLNKLRRRLFPIERFVRSRNWLALVISILTAISTTFGITKMLGW